MSRPVTDAKRLRGFIRQSREAHTALETFDIVKELLERIQNYGDAAMSRRVGKLIAQATAERQRALEQMDRAEAGITENTTRESK